MVVTLQRCRQDRTNHLDVRDSVFVVRITDRLKAEFAIESHQIHLRPDPDWLPGEQIDRVHDCLAHEKPSDSGTAYFRMGDHTSYRRLGEPHSRGYNTRISEKHGMFVASQQMPRTGIDPVGIDVRTVLLHNKDSLP